VKGCPYQLSNSIRCCGTWISLFWFKQRQTCTCRHLNYGCFPISQHSVKCLDRLVKRPHDSLSNNFSVCSIDEGLYRPLSTICHRNDPHVCLWINSTDSKDYSLARFGSC